jgi:hypothetical protein
MKRPSRSINEAGTAALGDPLQNFMGRFRCIFCMCTLFNVHNEELNIVQVIKSRRIRWAGHGTRVGERGGVYRILVRKPEGKRPPGRPRRRWEDNSNMDL